MKHKDIIMAKPQRRCNVAIWHQNTKNRKLNIIKNIYFQISV